MAKPATPKPAGSGPARPGGASSRSGAAKAKPAAAKPKPAPKPRQAAKPVSKPAGAVSPMPVVVGEVAPPAVTEQLRKKQLIDAVVARSGIKKKDAKPVIEALLDVLGEALANGRELNLPPLGKSKVTRTKTLASGQVMTLRLRQPGKTGNPGARAASDPGGKGDPDDADDGDDD